MTNKRKYIIAGLIPIIILLSMTILPLRALLLGDEILLETEPYDPRDLFRGDYVVLNYKINELDYAKLPEELTRNESSYYNQNLYAVMKKVGNYYNVDYVTLKEPKNRLYLKCNLDYIRNLDKTESNKIAIMSYKLDKYFVPENTGHDLEDMSREGNLVAKIKVYKGYALLTDVNQK
ncbi:MAG: GDYXXLXY domain-containing protein [Firmicutes bacterium]|nr:GDYXXLXY domain-containing protein [Bacillota bacterium]